ncbi:MAG: MBL fold metallo-hydrolase [Planctomycetaceae bacterium]|jgi:phosphoribosyl 1,2-cyclic phosphodiesterase|nr:MBL fold metallo-hydrolase [Planctomycetaceae bacterium]MBT6155503.1 MBL fold metallo-hydrolase [Planctomycetaceae bacterium]MBT6485775.1 MBL fold metallo-hydrolase [Planctomycetaceae bacterium]MBT6494370.1 MBL fold metallo-hydrolase [Planctomycetaceae bacterium]
MDDLTVRFWGTRGSIPTPGRETEKFGGNTTCIEVRYGDALIVFDAGSGIREMGLSWMQEFSGESIDANLLFTHVHWDHIQGFPFFGCAYQPQTSLTIYGAERPGGGMQQLLSGQMSGDWFPVPLSAMQAKMDFRTVTDEFKIGPVTIKPFQLPHPGGALGYRVEAGDSVFVLATDCELDQVATNRDELKTDNFKPRQYDKELLKFFRGAQLLVIDCQYTDELYKNCVGWGHNSVATVVDICAQVHRV